jgi:hypothetical protein
VTALIRAGTSGYGPVEQIPATTRTATTSNRR